jgi:hypothetical protein
MFARPSSLCHCGCLGFHCNYLAIKNHFCHPPFRHYGCFDIYCKYLFIFIGITPFLIMWCACVGICKMLMLGLDHQFCCICFPCLCTHPIDFHALICFIHVYATWRNSQDLTFKLDTSLNPFHVVKFHFIKNNAIHDTYLQLL